MHVAAARSCSCASIAQACPAPPGRRRRGSTLTRRPARPCLSPATSSSSSRSWPAPSRRRPRPTSYIRYSRDTCKSRSQKPKITQPSTTYWTKSVAARRFRMRYDAAVGVSADGRKPSVSSAPSGASTPVSGYPKGPYQDGLSYACVNVDRNSAKSSARCTAARMRPPKS